MSKKSIDKDLLFEAIGDVKEEWIEKAVDYKRTEKIISFPFHKYMNMAAALIICIISLTVFVQLKPINEITVPEPTATAELVATVEPANTEDENISTDLPAIEYTESPVYTNKPDSIVTVPTKVPIIQTSMPSNRPISGPTKEPVIVQTKEPDKIPVIVTSEEPDDETVILRPTKVPSVITSSPEPSKAPENATDSPVQTSTPDINTETPEPPEIVNPTCTPMITFIPTEDIEKTPFPEPTLGITVTPGNYPGSSEPSPTSAISTIPSSTPSPAPTSTPSAPEPVHITFENASEYAVEGIPVVIESLNGAEEYTGDANGTVYTFTDTNASNRTGIKIENPIAGNTDYVQDYGFVRDLKDPTGQGRINVFDLFGSVLGWNRDEDKMELPEDQYLENPVANKDTRVWYVAKEDEIYYPKPTDNGPLKGFSMSFWVKTNKDEDNSAILTFANTNQTTTVSVNATAKYSDLMLSDNFFSTNQYLGKNDTNYRTGEWEYYTITFANDWICVYINGVEVKYDEIELSRKKMRSFNNGFLTRYNAAVTWTEEDFANDWRGYLKKQSGSSDLYPTITSDNYTVFGNGRYCGLGAEERLMLTFMTGMTTEVYLGGADVEVASGAAKYSTESGTQIAQVKYYLDELDYEQVYANYLIAEEPVTE